MRVGRFRGRKDLRAVIAKGLRFERQGVSIRCLKGRLGRHRIAVVCPKTVSRNAVERNRIRRVFFEALRLLLKDAGEPVDCAVLVRPGFRSRTLTRADADAIVVALRGIMTRL
jgi:ribonuclease P protein component